MFHLRMKHLLCLSLLAALLAAPAAADPSAPAYAGSRGDPGMRRPQDPAGELATLSGTVFNLALEPVRAAEVSVEGAGHAYTDLKGYFELPRVPFGTRRVKVTAPGYLPDATDLSVSRRFVEFQTTLQTAEEKRPQATMMPVAEPLPMPTLYGLSGRMALPEPGVLPERAQSVDFTVTRTGYPLPGQRQRVINLSYTIGLAERLEATVWAQDTGAVAAGKELERSGTGFGLKYAFKPIVTGGRTIPCAIGGRSCPGGTNEVFLAFDLPIFEGDHLTLVPILRGGSSEVVFGVGWDRPISRGKRVSSAVMLEAIQGVQHKFDLFNAGLRFTFKRDTSAHVIWRHNSQYHYHGIGLGASIAFD